MAICLRRRIKEKSEEKIADGCTSVHPNNSGRHFEFGTLSALFGAAQRTYEPENLGADLKGNHAIINESEATHHGMHYAVLFSVSRQGGGCSHKALLGYLGFCGGIGALISYFLKSETGPGGICL